MKKVPAYLLGGLLISGIAMAQEESDQTQKNSKGMDQKKEEMEQKQKKNTEKTAQKKSKDKNSAGSSKAAMTEQAEGQVRSQQLIESNIVNESDEEIGSITDLVVDPDGQVAGIIVTVGGFLGMGEKHVLLPWDSVDIVRGEDEDNYQVTTAMGKEELKNKENYKTEREMKADKEKKKAGDKIDKLKEESKAKKDKE